MPRRRPSSTTSDRAGVVSVAGRPAGSPRREPRNGRQRDLQPVGTVARLVDRLVHGFVEFEGVEQCAFRRRTGAGAVAGEERGACGDRPGSGTIVVGVLLRVEPARVGVETGQA